jgi:hypothetical protein
MGRLMRRFLDLEAFCLGEDLAFSLTVNSVELILINRRFAHSEFTPLTPTWDWVNRVPALDNGENIWGIYATIEALEKVGNPEYTDLANKWESYLNYLKSIAAKVGSLIITRELLFFTSNVPQGFLPRLRTNLRRHFYQ